MSINAEIGLVFLNCAEIKSILKKIEVVHKALTSNTDKYEEFKSEKHLVKYLMRKGDLSALDHVYLTIKFKTKNKDIIDTLTQYRIISSYLVPCYDEHQSNGSLYTINTLANITSNIYKASIQNIRISQAKDLMQDPNIEYSILKTMNLKEWRCFIKSFLQQKDNTNSIFEETKLIVIDLLWSFVEMVPLVFNDIARDYILEKFVFKDKENIKVFINTITDRLNDNTYILLTDYFDSSGLTVKESLQNEIRYDFYEDCKSYGWDLHDGIKMIEMLTNRYLNDSDVKLNIPKLKHFSNADAILQKHSGQKKKSNYISDKQSNKE